MVEYKITVYWDENTPQCKEVSFYHKDIPTYRQSHYFKCVNNRLKLMRTCSETAVNGTSHVLLRYL